MKLAPELGSIPESGMGGPVSDCCPGRVGSGTNLMNATVSLVDGASERSNSSDSARYVSIFARADAVPYPTFG